MPSSTDRASALEEPAEALIDDVHEPAHHADEFLEVGSIDRHQDRMTVAGFGAARLQCKGNRSVSG